jgi:hypothetical protein
MSNEPPMLLALRTFLQPRTGLRAISLGIVGNKRHKRGYHLGRDRIFGPEGQGKDDYSIELGRDKAALTNAAAAMDIGSFRRLREMSIWIVAQTRAGAPDTLDIREIIYSPDGKKVLRWDRKRGVRSRPKPGEADDTHRTHTHISWFRDTLDRDKTALFERFFEKGDVVNLARLTFHRGARMRGGRGIFRRPVADSHELIRNTVADEVLPLVGNTGTGFQIVQVAGAPTAGHVADDAVAAFIDIQVPPP